jgi:hypothetical protein
MATRTDIRSGRGWGWQELACGTSLVVAAFGLLSACQVAQPPPNVQIVVLRGSAYERGFQHGQQLSAQIRSLYTRLLASSILPFLNREQLNIAPILSIYNQPEYTQGQFSYRMLLESGQHLFDCCLPEDFRQELRGIADGAGMSLDQVVVLNTFFDTMMAFRSIVMFISLLQEPFVESIGVLESLDADGCDNDGDGQADELGEGVDQTYEPGPHAALIGVPSSAAIRIVLKDTALAGLACVDPRNAEPLGVLEIATECVLPACLRPECRTRARVGRDCLDQAMVHCIDPRVDGDCLLPDCIEATDPGCVAVDSIRITLGPQVFLASDPALQVRRLASAGPGSDPGADGCSAPIEVVFRPPGGFAPASAISLWIQAGDLSPIYSPAPFHHRFMRDERVTMTTVGYLGPSGPPAMPQQVPNRGEWDLLQRPSALGFGVRGTATPDGSPLLAHHFALLDSDMVHEHSVLLVHIPDQGRPHVFLSWAGLAWGFSGMNDAGLAIAINPSDSLDNPLVGGILEAMFEPEHLAELLLKPDLEGLAAALADTRLLATGLPIGIIGRKLLGGASSVAEGIEAAYGAGRTYGWNLLLADAAGGLAAVELDGASQAEMPEPGSPPRDEDGFVFYTPDPTRPENLDPRGSLFASTGPDDLRMTSHFAKNTEDMVELPLLSIFAPRSQRRWSRTYFRSLQTFFALEEQIEARHGDIDVERAIEILRTEELVDRRDSMNACVFEPATRRLHWAMGAVPATDLDFIEFDLAGLVAGGQGP